MPDPLIARLKTLSQDDLKTILVSGLKVSEEIINDKNKDNLVLLLSKELRAASSSTTASLVRNDHAFPYKQILIDVADKLTPGNTPLSWTKYRLEDNHTEAEIEEKISTLFEDKARKWWNGLPDGKKLEFSNDISKLLQGQNVNGALGGGIKSFVTQQAIENVIQAGIMKGVGSIAAGGIMGGVGISIFAQLGWIILLQTVGWMGGLKIAVFGVAGYGALGGAVAGIGTAAIGAVLSAPTLFVLVDGAAYRKTVPTIIMLIARLRNSRNQDTKMAISLQKGGNVNLSKADPNLKQVLLGLGWDTRSTDGVDFDLDASIFMVTDGGKVRTDSDFIFYGQLRSSCGSIEHTGDNRTGAGDGDDEALKINLDQVPAAVVRLVVAVTIHEAQARKQNFGMVHNAFIRLVNSETNVELTRFDLSEDSSTETAMVFGEVYRYGGEWKFKAVGQGYAGGLRALAIQHGVDVQ